MFFVLASASRSSKLFDYPSSMIYATPLHYGHGLWVRVKVRKPVWFIKGKGLGLKIKTLTTSPVDETGIFTLTFRQGLL